MAKIRNIILMLFVAISCFAAPISEDSARKKAMKFMVNNGLNVANLNVKTAYKPLKKTQSSNKNAAYYIFNTSDNKGFVIVSGDDRTEEILGYSDNGGFSLENMPENLKFWLSCYEKEINSLDAKGITSAPKKSISNSAKQSQTVLPLVKTKWDQGYPYNDLCPEVDGKHCLTGCAATAFAMIMNYHKWPQNETTKIPSYRLYDRGQGSYSGTVPALDPITFDWSNIKNTYGQNSSKESIKAVAELMLYCGTAIQMSYGINGSGAQSSRIPYALQNYFGYSNSSKYVDRTSYTIEEWDNLLTNELVNKRPVLYVGYTTASEGHAFVCDGKRADGLYSINWGWGGYADGYFRISVLDANATGSGGSSTSLTFSFWQGAIIGISKDNVETLDEKPDGFITTQISIKDSNTYKRKSITQNFGPITTNLQMFATQEDKGTGTCGFNVYKDGKIVSTISAGDFELYGDGYVNLYYNKKNTFSFGANLGDGEYKLVPTWSEYSGYNNAALETLNKETHYIKATITGNEVKLEVKPERNIQVKSVEANKKNTVTFELYNRGEEFNGYIWMNSLDGKNLSMEQVAIKANSTEKITFWINPELKFTNNDIYALTTNYFGGNNFYSNGTLEGSKIEKELTIQNINEQKTIVYGGKIHVKANLLNSGTGKYINNVMLDLMDEETNEVVSSFKTIENIDVQENKNLDYAFNLTTIGNGKHYYIRLGHMDESGQNFKRTQSFKVNKGAIYWRADGSLYGDACDNAENVIPEDVVAANLRNVVGTNFKPNSNPNTIYMLDTKAFEGLIGRNLINYKGQTAKINLTDGYNFYIPEKIKTSKVTYDRTFTEADRGKWSTVILPFVPKKITKTANGEEVKWSFNNTDADNDLWILTLKSIDDNNAYFTTSNELLANTAYLIGVSKNLIGEGLTFESYSYEIEPTTVMQANTQESNFVGTNNLLMLSGVYTLNNNEFVFNEAQTEVKPFRAYLKSYDYMAPKVNVVTDVNITNSIEFVDKVNVETEEIYSITGVKMPNRNKLPKGIYIIKGKKVVVNK